MPSLCEPSFAYSYLQEVAMQWHAQRSDHDLLLMIVIDLIRLGQRKSEARPGQ